MDCSGVDAMPTSHISNLEYWKARAVATRALAEQMSDRAAKHAMQVLAQGYDELAQLAEEDTVANRIDASHAQHQTKTPRN
jgi:hypothetical protein